MSLIKSYSRLFRIGCGVAQVVFSLGAIGALCAAVVYAAAGPDVSVSLPDIGFKPRQLASSGAKVPGGPLVKITEVRASIVVPPVALGGGYAPLAFLSPFLASVLGAAAMKRGRLLFGRLENGEHFETTNPNLVRQIALLYIAGSLIGTVFDVAYAFYAEHMLAGVTPAGLDPQGFHVAVVSHLMSGNILFGLLLLLLAEVYREAVTLKEESALTI